MRKSRSIRTKPAVSMPDVIAKILVLEEIDHRRVGIFGCARRMRSGIVEELTQKAGEDCEILSSHHAGLEDHQTAILQEIAERGTKLVAQRPSIETEVRK